MKFYLVDAFNDEVFKGNPAAVYVLTKWPSATTMQKIALEHHLSETAFTVKNGDHYDLRWFTPEQEIDLCGHASLATAYVLFNYYEPDATELHFQTQKGPLAATRQGDQYGLDFPSLMPEPIENEPTFAAAMGAKPTAAYLARDLFLVYDDAETVRHMQPDLAKVKALQTGLGVIVTAPDTTFDFVSRAFYPKLQVDEDPVTGSAHSNLIPYWAQRLHKRQLHAQQASARVGVLDCEWHDDRVTMSGRAVLFATGENTLDV
ncbi:phenazine biosynthesis protein [Lactobacillus mucosae LM1] [Lactiplantibacillus mudanjiangensis]|uniref:PhzF family phenazine biosynthesis protein n=1 Tax=Lactiplantibacillus mudanjiangensis TaxID=1296538 RepID=UPI001014C312|nr:PhzF family phenazine biosynthesis protein [Lactiplantibacillus mudanjiangensis]VDG19996.1 phenazine biosynthesis protein [Lactobacillus mucosae LM1] [Lactiplantibacillus mudanjiangensis]VDG33391.1 phenazine biosynthesis protein [Lactobacillus mucosae LM1] [Lactiplantibacillus mudanjiangensis]